MVSPFKHAIHVLSNPSLSLSPIHHPWSRNRAPTTTNRGRHPFLLHLGGVSEFGALLVQVKHPLPLLKSTGGPWRAEDGRCCTG